MGRDRHGNTGADRADDSVLRALVLHLRIGARAPLSLSADSWTALLGLAQSGKLLGPLGDSLDDADVPGDVRQALDAHRQQATQQNQLNFAYTLQALQRLESVGIDAVVFKGPVRAREVYGRWGVRTSSDIDLLVRRGAYGQALEALSEYEILVDPDSHWWRHWLGEMPLRRKDGAGPIVDLHHKLQQPGGPEPRDLEAFFASSVVQDHGGARYRTLAPWASVLVSAIGYGKAVRHNEVWLHHAHELAVIQRGLGTAERAALERHAREQGLSRLLSEAMAAAHRLFGGTGPVDADVLALARDAFGGRAHRRFYRTRRLWGWLDGSSPRRGLALVDNSLGFARSEVHRLREQRRARQR